MQRKPIVGLSLKNYINTVQDTHALCQQINHLCGTETEIEQFVFPSLGAILAAQQVFCDPSTIHYGAQNIAPLRNGAVTGEYSIESLLEAGGDFVEIAHHERLTLFHETAELVNQKIKLALLEGITPVICIGEGSKRLMQEDFVQVLKKQLLDYLQDIPCNQLAKCVFAYEPGWAIGKQAAADSEFVHQAHSTIRLLLQTLFSESASQQTRIIYGGSVSKENVSELAAGKDVDGVFVGRFGHEPANYAAIVKSVKCMKEVK